jgi:phosphatidylglycerol---prolipoprotein diacylglyceryl transferase
MLPVLFTIHGYQAHSYGLMAFWAFMVPLLLSLREARNSGMPFRHLLALGYLGGLVGLVGARVMGILVHLVRHPVAHDPKMLILHSGSAYMGGLIAGLVFGVAYCRIAQISFWRNLDFLAPYVLLGEGIGRLGCLLAGCCYGIFYHGPFSITFPSHSHTPALVVMPRFPVQPLAFLIGAACCFILIALRKRMRFEGQLGLIAIAMYAVSRFLIEFLRGDAARGVWFDERISSSQILSSIVLVTAVLLFFWKRSGRAHHRV